MPFFPSEKTGSQRATKLPEIQDTALFLQRFLEAIHHARYSVKAQALYFLPGPASNQIADAFISAAKRGVAVQLNLDWATFQIADEESVMIFSRKDKPVPKLDELRANGVTIIETNRPHGFGRYFPIAGRNHTKLYSVDTTAAWIAGINLGNHSFMNNDIAMQFSDPEIVKKINLLFDNINENRPQQDYKVLLDNAFSVYIDSGKPARSLIYEQARAMIKAAKPGETITFVSQFVPDGRLFLTLLAAVMRGCQVAVKTAPKDEFYGLPVGLSYLFFRLVKLFFPAITLHHFATYVHAKILVIGQREALVGSHNMVEAGIMLGTQEIALHTTDTKAVEEITSLIERYH